MVLRVSAAWMEHPFHETAASAALAEPAEREPIAALAAPEAVALPDRAALVVLVLQASAARAAPGSMQVVSRMVLPVVMPDKVAPVAWAEPRAHRAPTRRLL